MYMDNLETKKAVLKVDWPWFSASSSTFTDAELVGNFRFGPSEMQRLQQALNILDNTGPSKDALDRHGLHQPKKEEEDS